MRMTSAIVRVAIGAVVLSLALVGCGGSTNDANTTTPTSTSPTIKPQAKVDPRTENLSGPRPTIASYIKDNGITETPVHKGDPGAPTVNMAIPSGWADAGQDTPDWAYSAIVLTGPEATEYAPSIVAVTSKLTGKVDPQKIIDLAPGELNNLDQYKPLNNGKPSQLAGFPAYQLAGTWVQDGQTKVVAQKTVVIPANDGVYVLQLNADGLQDQTDAVFSATTVVDDHTTITR